MKQAITRKEIDTSVSANPPGNMKNFFGNLLTNAFVNCIINIQLANANYQLLKAGETMTLFDAQEGKEYIISRVDTNDEELDAFLFSLGCYSGEPITVISRRRGGCTVSIKDGRYNIDKQLAGAIILD